MRSTIGNRPPDSRVALDVVCQGSPRQMGLSQGTALRERIQAALATLPEMEAFQLLRPRWLPMRLYRRLAEAKAQRYLRHALLGDDESNAERLAGIADGAGVSRREIGLLNVLESVLSDLTGSSAVPTTAACAAMAVTPDAAQPGEPIVTHNFDYLPQVQPFYSLRESRPAGKLRSLDFTAAPLCGTVDGINEKGLCITNNYAYVIDTKRPGPTISMLTADALAHCTTVDAAVDRIGGQARAGGGMLMLADTAGQIASLELSSTRCAVRRPERGRNWLTHTNRFQCAEMADVQLDSRAVYSQRAPTALRGLRVHQSADDRDQRFRQQLGDQPYVTAETVAQVMVDHGPEGQPSFGTICMHSNYWSTTACIQLFPQSRRMRVAYSSACQAEFVQFQL
jgi:hypothetical protein